MSAVEASAAACLGALLAGCAGWWATVPVLQGSVTPSTRARRQWVRPLLLAGAAAWWTLQAQPLAIGWLVATAVVASGVMLQVRAGRRAREHREVSRSVLNAVDCLVADLESGAPQARALDEAARACPLVAPAAESSRLGADVVAALRSASLQRGASDLRWVAAAWEVSQHSGSGLAQALRHVAGVLRARAASRQVVHAELASARATARLMAVLPAFTWLLGLGTGAAPWEFLLATGPGVMCLVLGLALALAGVAWIDALALRVEVKA